MPEENITYSVTEKQALLPFLLGVLNGRSRTTVKSYLAHRQVTVNGCVTTQFDLPLSVGDDVGSASAGPPLRLGILCFVLFLRMTI